MITIVENSSLRPYNTFAIEATARWMSAFTSTDELAELTDGTRARRLLVLGGGSNILLTGNFDGLVLRNQIKGIQLLHEDEEHVYVRAGAGENWDQFVRHCIGRDWAGVENLSLIPGNVGAAPMQNIGAYGVELQDVFHELEAWSLAERRIRTFTLSDCAFGYRDSVFKGRLKGQFIIVSVVLRLRKRPVFHVSYGAIREELEQMGVKELSIRAVSEAVIRIRRSKLPDPAEIGNAGSFFKNPTITAETFARLQQRFPRIVGYTTVSGDVKLAAGWLIEQCGWKGYRRGDAGVHARQALVLVNYGNAAGREIYTLSEEILRSVKDKFGVELEREVNIM
jgi:UDP-N-acetylmuramate dehydrogenase